MLAGKDAEKGPMILVIDDEPYILRALSYLLNREGYEVETARNGEEGLARAQAIHPRLIFLDIMMPQMDGYEVCQRLRDDPSLRETYVIMLTAKGQQVDRDRALVDGANAYMTKPFSPREIAQHLRTLFTDRLNAAPLSEESTP